MTKNLEGLIADAYRYAYSLCSNEAAAWDLVQESWLKVFERYDRVVTGPLLYRTIRNLFYDRRRHETRFPTTTYEDSELAPEFSSQYEHDPALDAALRTLPDVERETLFLAVVEGYTVSEITALTGHPRGSVLSRLHRARQKLSRLLDENQSSANKQQHLKLVSNRNMGVKS